eukprot:TRINITY_DN1626_c0_g1_i1.p2 TRINITY_DN1626_c0_g1~~TRINITY_DN1626_c0_g1_i1.p2  ORF type:complete len:100 (+),score=9.69 TRINITY_DN1626_c0_g1_i1:424-723(+)
MGYKRVVLDCFCNHQVQIEKKKKKKKLFLFLGFIQVEGQIILPFPFSSSWYCFSWFVIDVLCQGLLIGLSADTFGSRWEVVQITLKTIHDLYNLMIGVI